MKTNFIQSQLFNFSNSTKKSRSSPYRIGGSYMDEITFSILWHDHVTNARLVHAFYRASGVDCLTKCGVSKKNKLCVAAACL